MRARLAAGPHANRVGQLVDSGGGEGEGGGGDGWGSTLTRPGVRVPRRSTSTSLASRCRCGTRPSTSRYARSTRRTSTRSRRTRTPSRASPSTGSCSRPRRGSRSSSPTRARAFGGVHRCPTASLLLSTDARKRHSCACVRAPCVGISRCDRCVATTPSDRSVRRGAAVAAPRRRIGGRRHDIRGVGLS